MARFETDFPPYVPFGSRVLGLQSPRRTGSDVAVFQVLYNQLLRVVDAATTPIGTPVAVDGSFGPASRQAALSLQAYFGLRADGVVGSETFLALGQGDTYGGPPFGTRLLREGDSGGDVTVLQNRLNLYRYAAVVGKAASGRYDARTAGATYTFKQDAAANGQSGLTAQGVAGEGTFDALWLYTAAGGRGILPGRNGLDVAFVQVLLRRLRYYAGGISGYYDEATQASVRAFQTARGITADGEVGPATFHQLGIVNPLAAPGPLPVAWPSPAQAPAPGPLSVELSSPGGGAGPSGLVLLAAPPGARARSMEVWGIQLADPATLGAAYGAYAFEMLDPSGAGVAKGLMVPIQGGDGPADWAGSCALGGVDPPAGRIRVVPTPAGSADGPYGPEVLAGDLS